MAHDVKMQPAIVHPEPEHATRHGFLPSAVRVALRAFLCKLAINTTVLALLVPLLPGIKIPQATLWTYLGLGLVLSLLNRLLKPVLLRITGRLMLWNMLAWVTLINTFVLVTAGWLANIQLPMSSWPWVVIGAALISSVLTITEAVLGFDRPNLDANQGERAFWRVLERVPGIQRSRAIENLRLAQLYDTFWSYGIEIALGDSTLQRVRATAARWITGRANPFDNMPTPRKVRLMIEQLGPLYVKLAQIVSSQAVALSDEWRSELDQLQSRVTPFPLDQARAVIRAELGAPPEQIYASFDPEPLAAASLGQVHRATFADGRQVVVKVQRPEIRAKVRIDLRIMRDIAIRLERRYAWARELNLGALVAEYAAGVVRELDFHNEAYHAIRLADMMAPLPGVHVPWVSRALSTSKVLTMEFVSGVKITRLGDQPEAELDRTALARTFLRAITKQVLIDGFFHADPHPGNLYVDPHSGTIIFLDLGMMGELSRTQRRDLLDLMLALQQEDTVSLAQVLRRLSTPTRALDEGTFQHVVERVYTQEWKYGSAGTFGVLMSKLLNEMARNGLQMTQGLTLAVKAMVQAEEAVRTLAPASNVFHLITTEAKSLLGEQLTPERVVQEVERQVLRSGKELMRRIPSLADATLLWLDQYQRGKVGVELDTGDLGQQLGRLSSVLSSGLRSLAVALALCGMVIGAALAVGIVQFLADGVEPTLDRVIVVAFVAVLMFSAVVVGVMLRTPRSPDDESVVGSQ